MIPFQSTFACCAPLLIAASALLSGCDAVTGALGIESPEKVAAMREAEGKAIGGACRHAGHAIEDCYASNKKGDKAAIFAGWREMNDYMRENKIEEVPSSVGPTQLAGAKPAPDEEVGAKATAGDKPSRAEAGKPRAARGHDS